MFEDMVYYHSHTHLLLTVLTHEIEYLQVDLFYQYDRTMLHTKRTHAQAKFCQNGTRIF